MSEILQKSISANGEAVIYALDATAIVQETMQRIGLWPPATKHLGQAMMASLLLQALSDSDVNDSLSLQWTCKGPFGHLFAEARNFGEVRGTIQYPQPNVTDYETSLGEGLLQVRRSRGGRIGTTSIVKSGGLVSADIVEYLEKSEQKNCGINLSVIVQWEDEAKNKFRVVSALAYLIHIMPQPSEAKLNAALLRWDRQMQSLGPISRWLLREDQLTLDMIRLISGEESPKLVMTQRVAFRCNCSENRAARALALLEAQEKKEGTFHSTAATEIRCEYCGKTYTIEPSLAEPLKRGAVVATRKRGAVAATRKRGAVKNAAPKKRRSEKKASVAKARSASKRRKP